MMKSRLKQLFWRMLRFSALPWFLREFKHCHKVGILVYHDPEPSLFKQHLEFLHQRYRFIELERLVHAIETQDWSAIPVRALVITIDDGHKNNYKLLNICQQFEVRPTIYACSHIIGTHRHYWWKTGYHDILSLKNLSRHEMLKRLEAEVNYKPNKSYPERQSLSYDEIHNMSNQFDFQAHTCFHPILTTCQDNEAECEIHDSKHALEAILTTSVTHFAYPNGNYSDREIKYLKAAQYRSARTMDFGWNDQKSDVYRLKALDINEDASIDKLYAQITGVFELLKLIPMLKRILDK